MIVYLLTFPNSKKYVGITKNFNHRMSNHKYDANRGKSSKLSRAIRKYGWDNVTKEILFNDFSLKQSNEKEIELIQIYNSVENGYNIAPGGYKPLENQSEIMKQRMRDPKQLKVALDGLHSKESRRKQFNWTQSKEFSHLSSKIMKERIKNGTCPLPKLNKKVRCIETGEVFNSIREAASKFNGRREHLRDHLKGKQYRKLFKGLHFEVVGN